MVSLSSQSLYKKLESIADPAVAEQSRRYFKAGPGEYGEGDRFLGIRMPTLRKVAREYATLPLAETMRVLGSPLHEARLCALLILVEKFGKAEDAERKTIFDLYLANTRYVNNWDLVDSSAHLIVGAYLEHRGRRPLYRLSKSKSLWERRIAMIATYHLIRKHDFTDALVVAEQLLDDDEDLIHKAVGWMLREVGNRDTAVEKAFLKKHYREMPRTMLRYAIEKFPPGERKRYLAGKAT